MHSGEPEAQGEHDATSIAEYYKGVIYLYLPNITNEEDLLRSITLSLSNQCLRWFLEK